MDRNCLTQIRIIEADQLLPYEEAPLSDACNEATLENAPTVRHPLLVTPLDDLGFLLLDAPDYFQALCRLGVAHLPVQVCRPDQLTLLPVEAGLVHVSREDILRIASRHADQMAVGGSPIPAAGCIEVPFRFGDPDPFRVRIRHSKARGCPGGLKSLLREIDRIGRYGPISDFADSQPGQSAIAASVSGRMTIPAFELEDLQTAAAADDLFPFGVTGVSPSFRVLDIDFPISVLRADISATEKELFLKDLVALRQQSRRTSSFMGQVYLLNRPT